MVGPKKETRRCVKRQLSNPGSDDMALTMMGSSEKGVGAPPRGGMVEFWGGNRIF